jgi:CTP:molybdopterin cytidylyltransferase MocA
VIAALILAGGGSRRAGGPKALLPFPELPLVARQWLALRTAGCDPLRIAVGADGEAVARGSGLARENFVPSQRRGASPFAELQAGLSALLADDTWPAAVVQPVDALPPHPSLVVALAERLLGGEGLAAVPVHGGRTGHPAVLSRPLCEDVVRMDGRREDLGRLLARLEAAGACERVEAYTPDVLVSLDGREAYERALRAIEREAVGSARRRGRHEAATHRRSRR